MAQPVLLQNNFSGGMKPDLPRDQMPRNAVYNIEDYLPEPLGAPLRKRGGWTYQGVVLTDLNGSAGNVRHVCYAPFSAGAQVVALDDSLNRLFDLTNAADRGAAQLHYQAPIFYRNKLIIGTSAGGSAAPMKYTGSGAPSALGGSPPVMSTFTVYKDRLLGGSTQSPIDIGGQQRLYFSGPGDPEVWDTTNAYVDTSGGIMGMATLPDAVLVFHAGSVEILKGEKFPSSETIGELSLKPLFSDVGVYGPNAMVSAQDRVYWADQRGVYRTDGAAFVDLTKEGSIKNYWMSQTTTAGTGAFCAVGFYNGYVIVALLNSSRAFIDFLLCDPETRAWFRFTPITAKNFAAQYGQTDALYFSNQSTKRVGNLAPTFLPTDATKQDADALSILPVLDTQYYTLGSEGKKAWKYLYLGYDMRDAASDNPAFTCQYATSPEAVSYTALSPTLTESTAYQRKRMPMATKSRGVSLSILQFGNSGNTRIYGIEAEAHPLEGSRRG